MYLNSLTIVMKNVPELLDDVSLSSVFPPYSHKSLMSNHSLNISLSLLLLLCDTTILSFFLFLFYMH